MRFKAGVDTDLSTLVVQRALFSAELTLISVHSSQLQSQITLYQTLRGGWQQANGTPDWVVCGLLCSLETAWSCVPASILARPFHPDLLSA